LKKKKNTPLVTISGNKLEHATGDGATMKALITGGNT